MLKDKITHIIELGHIDKLCEICTGEGRDNPSTHAEITSDNVIVCYCDLCVCEEGIKDTFKITMLDLRCETICEGRWCDDNIKYTHAGLTHDKQLVAVCEHVIYSDDIKGIPYVLYAMGED